MKQLNPRPFIILAACTSVSYALFGPKAAVVTFAAYTTLMAIASCLP